MSDECKMLWLVFGDIFVFHFSTIIRSYQRKISDICTILQLYAQKNALEMHWKFHKFYVFYHAMRQ